jgi:excisionase family DNA binding protein
MNDTTNAKFYTPREVADQLKLNLLTIYAYIRSKKLMAIKIGRSYRIQSQDFDLFIKQNRVH